MARVPAYVMLPLVMSLVGRNWLALPRAAYTERLQPFKALDQGFRWLATKLAIVALYFLSTLIIGALKIRHPASFAVAGSCPNGRPF